MCSTTQPMSSCRNKKNFGNALLHIKNVKLSKWNLSVGTDWCNKLVVSLVGWLSLSVAGLLRLKCVHWSIKYIRVCRFFVFDYNCFWLLFLFFNLLSFLWHDCLPGYVCEFKFKSDVLRFYICWANNQWLYQKLWLKSALKLNISIL